jgi:hypothetical protein
MLQLCRVNQDPVEISGLLGVIEMKGLNSKPISCVQSDTSGIITYDVGVESACLSALPAKNRILHQENSTKK